MCIAMQSLQHLIITPVPRTCSRACLVIVQVRRGYSADNLCAPEFYARAAISYVQHLSTVTLYKGIIRQHSLCGRA